MTDTNASRDRPKSVPGPSLSGTVLDPRTAGSSSLHLFRRARRGDSSALDALFARHLPRLRRWAHGRLPKWARSVADTTDLVQDVLLQTFRRLLANFEPRRDQALQAYLRMAIDNRVRDEIRRFRRRPPSEPLDGDEPVERNDPSAVDRLIDQEKWDLYRRAVGRLDPDQRRLIIGRAELGYSYQQLALVECERNLVGN